MPASTRLAPGSWLLLCACLFAAGLAAAAVPDESRRTAALPNADHPPPQPAAPAAAAARLRAALAGRKLLGGPGGGGPPDGGPGPGPGHDHGPGPDHGRPPPPCAFPIHVRNDCRLRVSVSVSAVLGDEDDWEQRGDHCLEPGIVRPGEWCTRAWFNIDSGDTINAIDTTNRKWYLYGEATDRWGRLHTWTGEGEAGAYWQSLAGHDPSGAPCDPRWGDPDCKAMRLMQIKQQCPDSYTVALTCDDYDDGPPGGPPPHGPPPHGGHHGPDDDGHGGDGPPGGPAAGDSERPPAGGGGGGRGRPGGGAPMT